MIVGRLGKVMEVLCWVAGTALVTLYFGARFAGEVEREQGIEAFVQARATVSPEYPAFLKSGLQEWPEHQSLPGSTAARSASVSQGWAVAPSEGLIAIPSSRPMPIAVLRIASVGLEVPVFADTSERNLNRGAGWVEGTAAPDESGNMAIAAHRDGYFRALKDVAVGDDLVLQSITRETTYRVTGISIVEPDNTSALLATDTAAVTLVTCYPFYFVGNAPQRYIVRAVAL